MIFYAILSAFFFPGHSKHLNGELIKFGLSHYGSRSVILLNDINVDDYKKLMLSQNDMYLFAVMTFSNFEKSFNVKYQGVKSTVVVFDYDNTFIEFLKKVSRAGSLSSYKWLLTTLKFNLEDFRKVEIPLNSEVIIAEGQPLDGYNLYEIYETQPGVMLCNFLGTWINGTQKWNISTDLFERRKDLKGAVIKIVSPRKDPCSKSSIAVSITPIVHCIHKELWDILSEMLNITSITVIEPHLTENTLHETGAELTLRSFAINPIDVQRRSFLWPVFHTQVNVVASLIGQKVEWRTFIRPFSKEMWMGVLICIIFCDLALILGEILTRSGSYKDAILNYLSKYSFGALFVFCDQSVSDAPNFISYRIIFLMMFLLPSVLLPGYSAIVTSYLTVPLRNMPFRNLQELSQAKDYDLGWHCSFPPEYFFSKKNSDPIYEALLKNNVLPEKKLPRSDIEGVERMCNTKFAYITTRETLSGLKPKCNYFKFKQYFRIVFTTMEIKRGSWYEGFLNRCERSIDFSRTLFKFAKDAAEKFGAYYGQGNVKVEEKQPIFMENIILPFVVLLLGVMCSIILLLLEIIHFKRTVNRGTFTRRKRKALRYPMIIHVQKTGREENRCNRVNYILTLVEAISRRFM